MGDPQQTEPAPSDDCSVQVLSGDHAAACAELHRTGIDSGFLSSLGLGFLKQLYAAIPSCPAGFGFVWQDDTGEILGFVACSEATGRLYKQALLRRGVRMSLPLAKFLVRPSVLKRMWHTWRYPAETEGQGDLPPAEILSIAVSPAARGRGVARSLLAAAFAEFAKRGIGQAKVAVWAENAPANALYQKVGFALVQQREHHGLPMNIYTVATEPGTGMPG